MFPKKCEVPAVSVFTSVASLPGGWDHVLPEEHALQTKTLAIYEAIRLPDISTYYALCGSGDNPRAIAYFQLLKVQPKHLNKGLLSGIQSAIVPPLLGFIKPSMLVAGHLFRHDIATFFPTENLSNIDAYRVYEQMIITVAKQACAVAVLVKDVPEKLVPYFQNYAPKYSQLRNDISMQMKLPADWQTFVDYELALKHKYAQKLRKVRSSLGKLSVRELSVEEVVSESAIIFKLYEQVSRNRAFSMGLLNEQFLPELKKYYDKELKVWAFYEGETMVAFASAWLHQDAFDMFYIGFDYEKNATLNLYFNILYFSIEQAILARKPLLILGRTALEAKARLGCTPHYLHTFLLVRSPYLRRLVSGKLNNQHQQEGAWEERHPFKVN
ncbi:MAG: hypothetical protein WC716_03705 [Chitinophagaceae bacterium]|jgi:hypothetical protein